MPSQLAVKIEFELTMITL